MVRAEERWPGLRKNGGMYADSAAALRQFAHQQSHTNNIFREINSKAHARRRAHVPRHSNAEQQPIVEPPKAEDLRLALLALSILASAGTSIGALYALISHLR